MSTKFSSLQQQRLTNCKTRNLGGIQALNDWEDDIDGTCNLAKEVNVLGKHRKRNDIKARWWDYKDEFEAKVLCPKQLFH